MVGDPEDEQYKGIIPRSFDYLFQRIKQYKEKGFYEVSIAFIQIYNETIQDLFNLEQNVRIRGNNETGFYLEGTTWFNVKSTNECLDIFKKGESNKVIESTKMNKLSSRSHTILIAKVEKKYSDYDNNDNNTNRGKPITTGMLYLVDLAGNERVYKTNVKAKVLNEAKKINYGLFVLGNCITALINGKTELIQYRNSTLTKILKDSLGGNSKTSIIINISPSNYNTEETVSSLNFGHKAMSVQNRPVVNKTNNVQAQDEIFQDEYNKLIEKYKKLKVKYEKVVDENEQLKSEMMSNEYQTTNMQNFINKNGLVSINELTDLQNEFEQYKIKNLQVIKEKDKEINELHIQLNKLKEEVKKKEQYSKNLQLTLNNVNEQKNIIEKEFHTFKLKQKKQENNGNFSKKHYNQIFTEQVNTALKKLNISKADIEISNFPNIIKELISKTEQALNQVKKYSENENESKIQIEGLKEKINFLQEKIQSYKQKEKTHNKKLKKLEEQHKEKTLELSKSNDYIQPYKYKEIMNTFENDTIERELNQYKKEEKKLRKSITTHINDVKKLKECLNEITKIKSFLKDESIVLNDMKIFKDFTGNLNKKIIFFKSLIEEIMKKKIQSVSVGKLNMESLNNEFKEQIEENKELYKNFININTDIFELVCTCFQKILLIKGDGSKSNLSNQKLLKKTLIVYIQDNIDIISKNFENQTIASLKYQLIQHQNNSDKIQLDNFIKTSFHIFNEIITTYINETSTQINNLQKKIFLLINQMNSNKAINFSFSNDKLDKIKNIEEKELYDLREQIKYYKGMLNGKNNEIQYSKEEIPQIKFNNIRNIVNISSGSESETE